MQANVPELSFGAHVCPAGHAKGSDAHPGDASDELDAHAAPVARATDAKRKRTILVVRRVRAR